MRYTLKITRDAGSNAVNVHPVVKVRDTVEPYRLTYKPDDTRHYSESLRVFGTREEAETAYREELLAAEFSRKTVPELRALLHEDLAALKRIGFSQNFACRLTGIGKDRILAYTQKANPPNPRVVAKLHLLVALATEFAERAQTMLPLNEGAGVTCQRRPVPGAKKVP